jgi:CRP-like cAMP-binding protein
MDERLSAFSPGSIAARLLRTVPTARIRKRAVARGEAVFRQGDVAAAVFLVERGRVRLARALLDGTSVTLHVAEAGESFAEASLTAARYHCDAIAEVRSIVLCLPKRGLLSALAADPAESLALAGALAGQVRDLRSMLELRNIRSAPARVLTWLRLHASGKPPVVSPRRSWTLIADELGLSREAAYRGLASLERQGRIKRLGNAVQLPNPAESPAGVCHGNGRNPHASAHEHDTDADCGTRGWLDVGAGGSDLTWQAFTGLGYQTQRIGVSVGYRFLSCQQASVTQAASTANGVRSNAEAATTSWAAVLDFLR